jgi:hypothetical protein
MQKIDDLEVYALCTFLMGGGCWRGLISGHLDDKRVELTTWRRLVATDTERGLGAGSMRSERRAWSGSRCRNYCAWYAGWLGRT